MKFPFKAAQAMVLAACSFVAVTGFAQLADDQIDASVNPQDNGSKIKFTKVAPHSHLTNDQAHARQGVPNIDSIPNWNDHYFAPGYILDANGNTVSNNHWYTNVVGNPPNNHGTTYINAPIIPVTVDLRNYDGSPRYIQLPSGKVIRMIFSADQYVPYFQQSPVFQNYSYSSSSTPTQFTDAVQRAEYYSKAKSDWHTILVPSVKQSQTLVLIRGSYRFSLNADGSLRYLLVDIGAFGNALFPATATDTTTPIGAAEHAGDMTTKDITTLLLPNTFLYFNGDSSQCCVIGYHTYDYEPGTASNGNTERRYVVNYSSFISPGIFRDPNFQDITAHSHEIAETFNDPFVVSDGVGNLTPWWLSDNGNCQNDLEVGDVVEGLPNAEFPVTLPLTINGSTVPYTFHPQNEALLQYFQEGSSDAIDGSYSYPDEKVLKGPTTVQKPYCQP